MTEKLKYVNTQDAHTNTLQRKVKPLMWLKFTQIDPFRKRYWEFLLIYKKIAIHFSLFSDNNLSMYTVQCTIVNENTFIYMGRFKINFWQNSWTCFSNWADFVTFHFKKIRTKYSTRYDLLFKIMFGAIDRILPNSERKK